MYTDKEFETTFEAGVAFGERVARKEHELLEDGLRRLMDAIRESENGDPDPLDDLAREAGVLREAIASGDAIQPDELIDDLERWLREQE
ncbi:hypothetical protein DKL51_31485 [Micromonospora globispora]|nr:hypothetical protein DKL51_31485 [Micromonospora globispora]